MINFDTVLFIYMHHSTPNLWAKSDLGLWSTRMFLCKPVVKYIWISIRDKRRVCNFGLRAVTISIGTAISEILQLSGHYWDTVILCHN